MEERIKIIIADDNKAFCNVLEKYLLKYEDIEILGIANTDEQEIQMIEELQPEIVITDLVRNYQYTGLEIIKKYNKEKQRPKFLIISADNKEDVIDEKTKIDGYIKKPFFQYLLIVEELRRIKAEIIKDRNQMILCKKSIKIKFEFWQRLLDFLKIGVRK